MEKVNKIPANVEYPIDSKEPKAIPYNKYPRNGIMMETSIPAFAIFALVSTLFLFSYD